MYIVYVIKNYNSKISFNFIEKILSYEQSRGENQ